MQKRSLWTRSYIIVIFMSALQNAQMQMVNPVMSKYGTKMGMGMNMAGLLVGILSFAALLTRPIGGGIADRLSNRPAAAVSSAVMGLSALGYIAAGESIPLLMGVRFFHGAAFGIGGTILMRMAGMLIPPDRMGEGMGYFALGQVLPMTAAPAISIFLSDRFGFGTAFAVAAASAFAAGALAFAVDAEKVKKSASEMRDNDSHCEQKGNTESLSRVKASTEKCSDCKKKSEANSESKDRLFSVPKETFIFAMAAAAVTFCQSQETAYIVMYGEELGLSDMGMYFTVSAAALFCVRTFFGKLIDRKSLRTVLVPSMICISAAMIMLAAVPAGAGTTVIFMLLMAASAIKSAGQAMAQPALQTASVNAVESRRSGAASAVYYMGCDLGQTLGPLAGGLAAGNLGYRWAYFLSAAVAAAGLLVFIKAGRKFSQ